MAFVLNYEVPGDVAEAGTPAFRLKRAIDLATTYDPGIDGGADTTPQSAAEYREYIDELITSALVAFVKRQEEAEIEQQKEALTAIDVVSS
jgi:hypothetical protein